MIINLASIPKDLTLQELMILKCKKEDLELESFVQATTEIIESLEYRKYIKITERFSNVVPIFELRTKGITVCDDNNIFLKDYQVAKEELDDFIAEYRKMFKDTGPGKTSDKLSIKKRLKWFFRNFPEYNDLELIRRATKKYIEDESSNNYRYLQRADYFIVKGKASEQTSRLASYCEEVQDGPEDDDDTGYNTIL